MTKARALLLVTLVAGGTFAVLGGEYSVFDWWQLRKEIKAEQITIDRLQIETDSLTVHAEALEGDPTMQEKVAREVFGMLRPGEILYRVESAN